MYNSSIVIIFENGTLFSIPARIGVCIGVCIAMGCRPELCSPGWQGRTRGTWLRLRGSLQLWIRCKDRPCRWRSAYGCREERRGKIQWWPYRHSFPGDRSRRTRPWLHKQSCMGPWVPKMQSWIIFATSKTTRNLTLILSENQSLNTLSLTILCLVVYLARAKRFLNQSHLNTFFNVEIIFYWFQTDTILKWIMKKKLILISI